MSSLSAIYYDGKSSVRNAVTVQFFDTGLVFTHGEIQSVWKYEEIKAIRGVGAITLNSLKEEEGSLVLQATPETESVLTRIVVLGSNPNAGSRKLIAGLLVSLAVVMGTGGLIYFYFSEVAVQSLVKMIPRTWDQQIDLYAMAESTELRKGCHSPESDAALLKIVNQVTQNIKPKIPFKVSVIDLPIVNAIALPGGTIFFFRGFVEKMESESELGGVLAHEIQHVIQRHGTRSLLRGGFASAFLLLMTGTSTSSFSSLFKIYLLQYSREAEEEADQKAIELLTERGMDPTGLAKALSHLQKEPKFAGALAYLSTHPDTTSRIQSLQSRVGRQTAATPVLNETEWLAIRYACKKK